MSNARYRSLTFFESEDGVNTVVEKVASWVGEKVIYLVIDNVTGLVYEVKANSVSEAFEKIGGLNKEKYD